MGNDRGNVSKRETEWISGRGKEYHIMIEKERGKRFAAKMKSLILLMKRKDFPRTSRNLVPSPLASLGPRSPGPETHVVL